MVLKIKRKYFRPDAECMLCDGEGKYVAGQKAIFRPSSMDFDIVDDVQLCECCEEEEPDIDPNDVGI